MNTQNLNFFVGENFLFILFLFNIRTNKIRIAATMATTPPSFDGIARKIAYANKKYHSGWMWAGVVVILAVLKFSTSPNMLGLREIIILIITIMVRRGVVSFTIKKGKNFILS